VRYRDRFLFDLQGYLTVPDALSDEAVGLLNDAVDGMVRREMGDEETTRRWSHLLARGRVFCDLIDNPVVLPVLEELLGEGFRLDHEYLDLIRSGMGPIGSGLHGGAVPFRPAEYYWSGDGHLHSGLVAVAYTLKDVGPDDGGFACVPGSHKSAFAFPDGWKDLADPHPCVRGVTGPAGSAIVFTEALAHGTLPWRGSDERRTVFYKYSPRTVTWSETRYDPAAHAELTDRQRAMLRSPGIEHMP
jgi:Phytanoyl-CoA dioxygenase (PhyH)